MDSVDPPSPCPGCKTKPQKFRYRDSSGWRCKRCCPPRQQCFYQDMGCPQTDIENKCWKHQFYFCERRFDCYFCGHSLDYVTLIGHYASDHQDVTHKAGVTWTTRKTAPLALYCLVSGAPVSVVCRYKLDEDELVVQVYIPVPSERLYRFKCTVKIVNIDGGQESVFTPDVQYDEDFDWCVQVKKEDFDTWSTCFGISVKIDKNE